MCFKQCEMTSVINNLPKQTLSFLSITVAWTATMILFTCYQVLQYGKTQDSGVIIFWSGLFVLIAWTIFLAFPLSKLDHSRKLFNIKTFPFIAGIYGGTVYALLVGSLFQSLELVSMFLIWAIITGVFFGLAYSVFIRSSNLIIFLNKNPVFKVFSPLAPFIFIGFFLWLLPTVFPSLVFRFMPDPIQRKIIVRTLPKFKKGDKFSALQNALPGYFEGWILNGNGTMSFSGGLLDYEIYVKNDTIEKLTFNIKD